MRYSKDIEDRIIAELEKVPFVRQACAKVGIDHSTFYRWMVKNPIFLKRVLEAQHFSRKRITDAAESVILNGIQNMEFKSAAFWLTHNEQRYMTSDQGEHKAALDRHLLKILETDFSKKLPKYENFLEMFEIFLKIEKDPSEKEPKNKIQFFVEFLCENDKQLQEICYLSYERWKEKRDELSSKAKELGAKDPYDENEDDD